MARVLRSSKERNISEGELEEQPSEKLLDGNDASSDLEIYSQEVLNSLIDDNLPPTPNNFSLYFDRLLEKKSESIRKQIITILELENSNEDENTIELEHTLKKGFSSVKNILSVSANLYKNISLMTKILDKRKNELESSSSNPSEAISILFSLEADISKLNAILKKQTAQMKTIYDETAAIVKTVENETIFDNQFGVYNKRYLLSRVEHEVDLIKQFKHKSSLIFIELSRDLKKSINNEKAITLMTRTIARLLLKTSRRSDIVAHFGNGRFSMLLKHTNIESAKKASERLCDLVSNSNFFLADKEIQLRISIGITDIDIVHSVEEIIVSAMNGIEKAYELKDKDYAVSLLDSLTKQP